MNDYLIFRLYGAMASWGDIAVGSIRPSYRQPSKSAIIGLLAAAMGIRRNEEERQQELFKLLFSVRVDAFGEPMEDYHTIQAPSEQAIKNDRGKDSWTRLDEVEAIHWRVKQSKNNKEAGAIQSHRSYYCDALYTIALCENSDDPINWNAVDCKINSLNDLTDFLEKPKFSLYLGRKSCPLGLPLQEQIQPASSCQEAIGKAAFDFQEELSPLLKSQNTLAWYSEEPLPNSQMKMTRRDQPVNKISWQFTDRDEYYASELRSGDVSA